MSACWKQIVPFNRSWCSITCETCTVETKIWKCHHYNFLFLLIFGAYFQTFFDSSDSNPPEAFHPSCYQKLQIHVFMTKYLFFHKNHQEQTVWNVPGCTVGVINHNDINTTMKTIQIPCFNMEGKVAHARACALNASRLTRSGCSHVRCTCSWIGTPERPSWPSQN